MSSAVSAESTTVQKVTFLRMILRETPDFVLGVVRLTVLFSILADLLVLAGFQLNPQTINPISALAVLFAGQVVLKIIDSMRVHLRRLS